MAETDWLVCQAPVNLRGTTNGEHLYTLQWIHRTLIAVGRGKNLGLLVQDSACNTGSGRSCRIRFVIICALVNHDGRAVFIEQRRIQNKLGIEDLDLHTPRFRYVDIRHVAGMHTILAQDAMVVTLRVVMAAR